MNMIQAFNQTMDYIERVLDGAIDGREIARQSGYPYALFSRIFSILTGQTLNEYIRLRRLTEAAIDLRETEAKIIDIAMKYGYDAPDAFSAAFKHFHGHTPSEVRKGKPFKIFSRIQLSLSIKGGRTMEVSIQKKGAFTVAGIKMEGIDTSLCFAAWEQLFRRVDGDTLAKMGNGQLYGMCYDVKDCDRINYMACCDLTHRNVAAQLNLDVVDVPENEYAVVRLKGAIPEVIHDGWKYLLEVFFPEQGYRHSGAPDFEVYGKGDMHRADFEMELWVPVVREM